MRKTAQRANVGRCAAGFAIFACLGVAWSSAPAASEAGPVLKPQVSQGSPGPEESRDAVRAAPTTNHWSFQPLQRTPPPRVKHAAWPRGDIDRFILARLEEKRLSPSRDADKQTLLRRLTFDLTGLPPSPGDVEAFRRDDSPEAVAHVVDRLLASKQFGERWGRHWLDVARYADSNGSDENFTYYDAWRFRNYVIEAFNQDKPFHQFVREQVAGDLLPSASQEQRDEQITATGFLVLGPKVIGDDDKEQLRMDVVDEQIDTVGKAFLGLTLGCARCHDHKFDPVPMRDYYALAGIFGSTETVHGQLLHRRDLSGWNLRPLGKNGAKLHQEWEAQGDTLHALKEKHDKSKVDLARMKKQLEAATNEVKGPLPPAAPRPPVGDVAAMQAGQASSLSPRKASQPPALDVAVMQQEISSLEQVMKSLDAEMKQLSANPKSRPPLAMAVSDRATIEDTPLRLRGEVHRPGELVPRGFIQAATRDRAAHLHFSAEQSGRLELADWLVDPANPLTVRVVVNRIWHHLFGVGLVRTVDDFGHQGEPPSHPELLDYLASRFMEVNWSFKRMIREMVLSRTYQMSSEHRERAFAADPENHLWWRMNRRRLDIEALRDGILAISGQLDPTPAESVVAHLPDQATGVGDKPHPPLASLRRSVYLPVIRNDLRPEFQVFDFADPQTVSGRRPQTMVAPQPLFLMNGELLRDSARILAEKLWKQTGARGQKAFVRAACSEILGRPATADELRFALGYLDVSGNSKSRAQGSRKTIADSEDEKSKTAARARFCQALLCSSQFLYVD